MARTLATDANRGSGRTIGAVSIYFLLIDTACDVTRQVLRDRQEKAW